MLSPLVTNLTRCHLAAGGEVLMLVSALPVSSLTPPSIIKSNRVRQRSLLTYCIGINHTVFKREWLVPHFRSTGAISVVPDILLLFLGFFNTPVFVFLWNNLISQYSAYWMQGPLSNEDYHLRVFTARNLVQSYQHLKGTCCCHLQDKKVRLVREQGYVYVVKWVKETRGGHVGPSRGCTTPLAHLQPSFHSSYTCTPTFPSLEVSIQTLKSLKLILKGYDNCVLHLRLLQFWT
jgi:hypothetical protein